MPVTHFHFGPGGLITLASRGRASFLAFCAANVLIDMESLVNMVRGAARIHTFLHTYIGSTLAALAVVLLFVPARSLARRLPAWRLLAWRELGIATVGAGALLGAWTHVVLDSIMHGDITPLAPFTDANGLYRIVSLWWLHLICVGSGVLALLAWLMRLPAPARVDPRSAAVGRLLAMSDALMQSLYPAGSNHLESGAALAAPNVRFLGIRERGELVACGAVKLLDDDGRYGEIKRLFVSPEHRGRGHARRMMAALEATLLREGVHVARLETGTLQPEALALYRALGYAERAPFGAYVGDEYSVFMEKRLT